MKFCISYTYSPTEVLPWGANHLTHAPYLGTQIVCAPNEETAVAALKDAIHSTHVETPDDILIKSVMPIENDVKETDR